MNQFASQSAVAGSLFGGAGAVLVNSLSPAVEVGHITIAMADLESKLKDVCGNHEQLASRLGAVLLPHPVPGYGNEQDSVQPGPKEREKCDLERQIRAANDILTVLAERQRLLLGHIQL